ESCFARPCGCPGRGGRCAHVVHGGHPGRWISPAGGVDAAAICHRVRVRSTLARIFLLERKGQAKMTLAHESTSEFLESTTRARREIITPEGVAVPVDLAEHGARAVAFVIDLFIWLVTLIIVVILLISIAGVSTAAGKVAISIALFFAF